MPEREREREPFFPLVYELIMCTCRVDQMVTKSIFISLLYSIWRDSH